MSLCFHQEWLLWRTEHALCRSDPHLAGMLALFSRLGADEPMPAREHVRTRLGWLRRPLARATARAGLLAGQAGHLTAVMLIQSAAAWAAASGPVCQVPPWPDSSPVTGRRVPGHRAGGGRTGRADHAAGAG